MNEAIAVSDPHRPRFTPAHLETAIAAVLDGCKATRTARRRSEGGPIEYVEVPDHGMRIVAAKIVIEHTLGKPVSTVITADLSPKKAGSENMQDWLDGLLKDPTARKALGETALKLLDSVPSEIVVFEENPAPPESQSVGSPR